MMAMRFGGADIDTRWQEFAIQVPPKILGNCIAASGDAGSSSAVQCHFGNVTRVRISSDDVDQRWTKQQPRRAEGLHATDQPDQHEETVQLCGARHDRWPEQVVHGMDHCETDHDQEQRLPGPIGQRERGGGRRPHDPGAPITGNTQKNPITTPQRTGTGSPNHAKAMPPIVPWMEAANRDAAIFDRIIPPTPSTNERVSATGIGTAPIRTGRSPLPSRNRKNIARMATIMPMRSADVFVITCDARRPAWPASC